MGKRAAVATTTDEIARLDAQELEKALSDARLRLGMAQDAMMRSAMQKLLHKLEKERAHRAAS